MSNLVNADKPKLDLNSLEEAFKDNLDLMLFYLTWIKNGMNATSAYLELHPHVDSHSARVLGSRWLARVSNVDKQLLMKAYGLDQEKYFTQLKDGLDAIKSDITGNTYPDHKTRALYHDKLGKLLGIEADKESLGVEFKKGEHSFKIVVTRGNGTA